MLLAQLLKWLKTLNIEVVAERTDSDSTRVITFSAALPFPSTRRVWYVLALKNGQEQVSHREIEALLRHCWHAEQEVPKFPGAQSNGPTTAAMNAVKRAKGT
jgi:hypothetical protein